MEQSESLSRKERIRNLINPWQDSGMSIRQFCKQENICMHSFRYWLKKWGVSTKRVFEDNHEGSFIPVVIQPERKMIYPKTEKIEIICPNGIQIRLPGNIEVRFIKTLAGIE